MRRRRKLAVRKAALPPLLLLVLTLALSSCATKPTDMRTLVPAGTLVYLETNDLAAALQPIVDSKPFTDVAKSKPDLSALKGVQVAVAITGFETSEEKVNDEQSIGKIRPRFVAIVGAHAWNYQAVAFAEHKLGNLVADLYDTEPKLEKSEKHGGKYFTWTAADGRRAHALVIDSLLWFANDETAIDKAVAVRRGESDSIVNTAKVQAGEPGTLARGYLSSDGIAQIANLLAMKAATSSTDNAEMRTLLVTALPQMIRGAATDATWNSFRANTGIEDRFSVTRPGQSQQGENALLSDLVDSFFDSLAETNAGPVAAVLSEPKSETADALNTVHRQEDHFTATTAERRITSDLGFLGWLIAQLAVQ